MLSAAGKNFETEAKKQMETTKKEGQSLDKFAESKGKSRKGSLTVAREVINESGIKGLFRGGILRAAWTALGSGLYLGVYESGRVWLSDRRVAAVDEQ